MKSKKLSLKRETLSIISNQDALDVNGGTEDASRGWICEWAWNHGTRELWIRVNQKKEVAK